MSPFAHTFVQFRAGVIGDGVGGFALGAGGMR